MRNRRLRLEPLEQRQLLAVVLTPLSDEFPVNTVTDDYQEQAAVAVEPDGDFVVAWSSWGQDGSQGGVYAQRFQSDGTKIGDEIPVNSVTDGNQGYPDVAVDPTSGGFVVTWQNDAEGASDVYARAFKSDGTPAGDQVLINAADYDHYNPAVAALGGGDFVIAWDSFDSEAGSLLHARHFSATGAAQGNEFAPATGTHEMNADVASRGDGSFLITWQSSDGDGQGIAARMYDAGSQPVASAWTVNDSTTGDQTLPCAAVAADGSFAVAWLSTVDGTTDVAVRRYDSDGTAAGSQANVNGDISVQPYAPSIAAVRESSLFVAWTDENLDVFGRLVDQAGVPFALSSTAGGQLAPRVAAAGDRVVATWIGEDDDGDGVFGRIYLADTPLTAHAGGPYTGQEGTAVTLDASASQTSSGTTVTAYEWDFDNDGQYDDATGVNPTFTRTDDGIYTVGLRVTNSDLLTDMTEATVTVLNVAPTADAGAAQTVDEGEALTLDATGSTDPGNDIASYQWDFDEDGQFDDATGSQPTFSAAGIDGPATVTVRLKVTDDDGAVDTAVVEVTVLNVPPSADAGGPYVVAEGGTLQLDAGDSYDLGADTLTYAWDLDNDGQYDDATGVQTVFSAVGLDGPASATVGLKVSDGSTTASDTAVVIVNNAAPTASAGGPYSAVDGGTVLLSAAASTDPGGDIVSYEWDLDGNGTFETTGKSVPFKSDQAGTHSVAVRVTDSGGASATATAQVTVGYGAITDLGTITFNTVEGVYPATGNRWYQVTAGQAGFLTVVSTPASGTAALTLYDTSRTEPPLATGSGSGAVQRFDHGVESGKEYLVRVSGTSNDVDLTLLNLVKHEDTSVTVSGTDQDDAFEFTAGETRIVAINGVSYEFANSECTSVDFEGAGGDDSAKLTGGPDGETARLYPDRGSFGENGYVVLVNSVASITAYSGGGVDVAFMYDSPGDDEFIARKGYGKLSGDGYALEAFDFFFTYGYATTRDGGTDIARMEDTPGSDKFKFDWPQAGKFFGKLYRGGEYYNRAKCFEQIEAVMTDGNNTVCLFDSKTNDTFYGQRDQSRLTGSGFDVTISGYDSLIAYASKGTDLAYLEDSDEDDTVRARSQKTMLWGGDYADPSYMITLRKYDDCRIEATHGGYDKAKLHDTVLDDHVDAAGNTAALFRNDGEKNLLYEAIAFEWVRIYGTPNDGQITNRNTLTKTDPLDFEFVYDSAVWEELP